MGCELLAGLGEWAVEGGAHRQCGDSVLIGAHRWGGIMLYKTSFAFHLGLYPIDTESAHGGRTVSSSGLDDHPCRCRNLFNTLL